MIKPISPSELNVAEEVNRYIKDSIKQINRILTKHNWRKRPRCVIDYYNLYPYHKELLPLFKNAGWKITQDSLTLNYTFESPCINLDEQIEKDITETMNLLHRHDKIARYENH